MMATKIKIINLNCGNINSIENAFKFLNCDTSIEKNFDDLTLCDGIVIPGNGNFHHVSEELEKRNKSKLIELIEHGNVPILGICIGFQIMFKKGYENSVISNGLGIFEGDVKLIQNKKNQKNFSLPHIGWNTDEIKKNLPLFDHIQNKSSFYFLHSYACNNIEINHCTSATIYGEDFISTAEKKNVVGVQFHPEKSHSNGIKFLNNWLKYYVKN